MIEYSKLISGDKFIYNSEKTIHFFYNAIFDSLELFLNKSEGIDIKNLFVLFSTFTPKVKQVLFNRFVAKQINNINLEIDNTEKVRKETPVFAIDAGKYLIKATRDDLEYLNKTLSTNNYQYQQLADKLSLEIVDCGIASFSFYKKSNGDIDYNKAIESEGNYIEEYRYANSIACSQIAKEKAANNLNSGIKFIKNFNLYTQTCWFCEKNNFIDSSEYRFTIYNVTDRDWLGRSVQYSYRKFSIPRCRKCEKIHNQSYAIFIAIILFFIILGIIICVFIDGDYWALGLILGGLWGFLVGSFLKKYLISKAKIKDNSHSSIYNYPSLKELIHDGWQYHKPRAL
jgi:hypothetical protein